MANWDDGSSTLIAASGTLPDGVYLRGSRFWIRYYGPGADGHMEQKREPAFGPTGKPARSPKEAEKFRDSRLAEVAMHRRGVQPFHGRRAERVLFTELLNAYEQDAELKGRKSLLQIRSRCKRLCEYFAGWRALGVNHDALVTYVKRRQAEGAANATINRETEVIGAAFALAVSVRKLAFTPPIPSLDETANVREGFFEADEFEAVRAALSNDDLADFIEFLCRTGWRKGEGATLTWARVDVPAGVIHLRSEHAKTGRPRLLALDAGLKALIARRWAARQWKAPDGTVRLSELVFHRNGRPMGDFRKAWAAACIKAGLFTVVTEADGTERKVPARLVHDLRRTAVRDMTRAGVRETVAMAISGHRTRSVFDRYNITSEEDLRQALASTSDYRAARPRVGKIVSLGTDATAGVR